MRKFFVLSVVLLSIAVLSLLASSSWFSFSGWWLEGDARYVPADDAITLTYERAWSVGRAIPFIWLPENSSFVISFQYRIVDTDGQRADGFVIGFFADLAKLPSLSGLGGGQLGFGNSPAWGIEFDEYQNSFDPSAPHIALINASVSKHVVYNTSVSFAFTPNTWHNCTIIVSNTSVEVYVDGELVLSYSGSLTIYGYGVFISGATSGSADEFEVRYFTVQNSVSMPLVIQNTTISIVPSFSSSKGSFNVLSISFIQSTSHTIGSFNVFSYSIKQSVSTTRGSFNQLNYSVSPSYYALAPNACYLISYPNGTVILAPDRFPWLNTSYRYRFPILVLIKSSGWQMVVVRTGYAKDIEGNGSVWLALDDMHIDGAVYVFPNYTLVVAFYVPSNVTAGYHYLFVYYGSLKTKNVGVYELPIIIDLNATEAQGLFTVEIPSEVYNDILSLEEAKNFSAPIYLLNATGGIVGVGMPLYVPGFVEVHKPLLLFNATISYSGVYYVWMNVSGNSSTVVINFSSSYGGLIDTFETWSGWTQHGSGVVEQSNETAFEGEFSLKKDQYPDPNGGVKSLGNTLPPVGCYEMIAWMERNVTSTAYFDRIGLVNSSGYGYGIAVGHGSPPIVGIDKRSNYGGALVASTNLGINPVKMWYQARLEICYRNGKAYVSASVLNDVGNKLLGEARYVDSDPVTNLDTAYVFGGYPYYVDLMIVAHVGIIGNSTSIYSYTYPTDWIDPCIFVEKYTPPPPPTTTTTITPPPLTYTSPLNITLSPVAISIFRLSKPSLFSPEGLIVLAIYLAIFIVYARIEPWYKALAVSSALMLVISLIWFGLGFLVLFTILFVVGITLWRLYG